MPISNGTVPKSITIAVVGVARGILDGGGALMNQSIHAIDLLQYFMGPVQIHPSVHRYIGARTDRG